MICAWRQPFVCLLLIACGCSTQRSVTLPPPVAAEEALDEAYQAAYDAMTSFPGDDQATALGAFLAAAEQALAQGEHDPAREQFENALALINNNELRYGDFTSESETYERVVDRVLDAYRRFMNQRSPQAQWARPLVPERSTVSPATPPAEAVSTVPPRYPPVPLVMNRRVQQSLHVHAIINHCLVGTHLLLLPGWILVTAFAGFYWSWCLG